MLEFISALLRKTSFSSHTPRTDSVGSGLWLRPLGDRGRDREVGRLELLLRSVLGRWSVLVARVERVNANCKPG